MHTCKYMYSVLHVNTTLCVIGGELYMSTGKFHNRTEFHAIYMYMYYMFVTCSHDNVAVCIMYQIMVIVPNHYR